ncbi:hypothetical protein [Synechococcus sp. PCC 6312]|uniref:hypothetical protein n=1 Tax=Synechococcus sp. (strain ATCC 27167 / PCC 6312) TaxID=195253 RepID=UPI00029F35DB|nr:hypothetical protein [Synechococcus sp. PCC 6312]AFY59672.1 hypothetical protein Syn6312_0443 [Synechococcus sp. PCC 6312]
MLKLATSSTVFFTLSFVLIAEAANCPLVDVAGSYSFTLQTEKASTWYSVDNNRFGCRKTGGTEWKGIKINPDGTMVSGDFVWSGGGRKSGIFSGRVEPSAEPMQWVGTAGDISMKGVLRRGQLSGQFVQHFIEGGKEVECHGTVSGFKVGK